MVTHLTGIKKIGFVDTRYLEPYIMFKAQAGIQVAVMTGAKEIKFFGLPEIQSDLKLVNFGTREATSIKFDSLDEIPLDKDIAFIVQDVNNDNFIIGTKENPAVVNRQYESSDPNGKATYKYTITNEDRISLIKIYHIW